MVEKQNFGDVQQLLEDQAFVMEKKLGTASSKLQARREEKIRNIKWQIAC